MADEEEVEMKNACIGSCWRVNISRLGTGHVRHVDPRPCHVTVSASTEAWKISTK